VTTVLKSLFKGVPNARTQVLLDEYDIAQPLPYIRRHPAWGQMSTVTDKALAQMSKGQVGVPTAMARLEDCPPGHRGPIYCWSPNRLRSFCPFCLAVHCRQGRGRRALSGGDPSRCYLVAIHAIPVGGVQKGDAEFQRALNRGNRFDSVPPRQSSRTYLSSQGTGRIPAAEFGQGRVTKFSFRAEITFPAASYQPNRKRGTMCQDQNAFVTLA
jgi:hypothetical protein